MASASGIERKKQGENCSAAVAGLPTAHTESTPMPIRDLLTHPETETSSHDALGGEEWGS